MKIQCRMKKSWRTGCVRLNRPNCVDRFSRPAHIINNVIVCSLSKPHKGNTFFIVTYFGILKIANNLARPQYWCGRDKIYIAFMTAFYTIDILVIVFTYLAHEISHRLKVRKLIQSLFQKYVFVKASIQFFMPIWKKPFTTHKSKQAFISLYSHTEIYATVCKWVWISRTLRSNEKINGIYNKNNVKTRCFIAYRKSLLIFARLWRKR